MPRWYRVFAAIPDCPSESLLPGATFGHDGNEWFWAELPGVRVERFLADEEGIRAELNAWAAVVEATLDSPALMERIIQSRQLFTLCAEDEALAERLARALALATRGCYQGEESGWHEGDSTDG